MLYLYLNKSGDLGFYFKYKKPFKFFKKIKQKFLWGFVLFFLSFFLSFDAFAQSSQKTFWKESFSLKETEKFITTKYPFNAFAVEIPKNTKLLVSSDQDQNYRLAVKDEDYLHSNLSSLMFIEKINSKLAHKISFKIKGEIKNSEKITFHFINGYKNNKKNLTFASKNNDFDFVISRAEWGADESLRFVKEDKEKKIKKDVEEKESGKSKPKERAKKCGVLKNIHPEEFQLDRIKKTENGKELLWPLQYSLRVFKVVLHHTAETGVEKGRNPDEVVRSIYAYHAHSRGWGDIGYHFIIDPYGQIYEGRAGGNFVVGGHVYCNNIGTIGVSLMGNFEDQKPTKEQLVALGKLLPRLAKFYELDLTATEEFHGKKLPNLIGHRDLAATACPGKNLYKLLPQIKKILEGSKEIIFTKSLKYEAKIDQKIEVLKMNPGEKRKVTFNFKNTGNIIWDRSTWLYVFQPKSGGISIKPAINRRKYVAARIKEKTKPGEIASFDVDLESGYKGGLFTLEFAPVVNNKKITSGAIIQPIEIKQPNWGAKIEEIKFAPQEFFADDRISVSVAIKNTGKTVWKKDLVTLMVKSGKAGKYIKSSLHQSVPVGKIGTFNLSIPPFEETGNQNIIFYLLLKGKRMPNIDPLVKKIEIKSKNFSASSLQKENIKTFAKINQETFLELKFKNTGNFTWKKEDLKINTFYKNERLEFLAQEKEVPPQKTATFKIKFTPWQIGNIKVITIFKIKGEKIFRFNWHLKVLKFLPKALEKKSSNYLEKEKKSIQKKQKNETKKQKIITKKNSKNNHQSKKSSQQNNKIRIKISFKNSLAEVNSLNDFILEADGQEIKTLKKTTIKKNGNKIYFPGSVEDFSIIRLISKNSNNILSIQNWSRYHSWDKKKKHNDNKFFDTLEFRVIDDHLVLINELSLEQYLAGVAESPEGEPLEKQKVMAVLARSYAAFYLKPENQKFPHLPFDGSDSPDEFQKFLGAGYVGRSPSWQKAVKSTKDLVVTYQGKLVKTPYFHQSDGRTKSAQEVWGWTNTPYLVSVPDPFCEGLSLEGHGVGLSGQGALQAAKKGKKFKEIIKYYYKGVEIEKSL